MPGTKGYLRCRWGRLTPYAGLSLHIVREELSRKIAGEGGELIVVLPGSHRPVKRDAELQPIKSLLLTTVKGG